MGTFVEPEDVKQKTLAGAQILKTMDTEDIDDLFIIPAEKAIAEVCNLDLNTDGYPRRWYARFTSANGGARLLAEYLADYRRAVLITVNHMGNNPHKDITRSIRGSTTIYSSQLVPSIVKSVMRKWSQPRRLFRT
jgi:hypothetical protein